MTKSAQDEGRRKAAPGQLWLRLPGMVREALYATVIGAGLACVDEVLEMERVARCGERYEHLADRQALRAGRVASSLVLGGRRVAVQRPRARSVEGRELRLPSWREWSARDPLDERALEQMVLGVSTGGYARSLEPLPQTVTVRGISKSAVSERLVYGTERKLAELMSRDLRQVHVVALLIDALPERLRSSVRSAINQAYATRDPKRARRLLEGLARRLEHQHPGAAASLREGLEETLTVMRLGLPENLERVLSSTHLIENLFGRVREIGRRVKRWQNGTMVLRWTAAGMLEAERGFRKVAGYRALPILVAALRAHDAQLNRIERRVDDTEKAA